MTDILRLRGKLEPELHMRPIGELWKENLPEPEPILGSWLRQRHLSMVYAPAGCGKSLLTMSMAMAIAGGGTLFGWRAPKPRKVLLVDGEMDLVDLRTRSLSLVAALPDADREAVAQNLMLLAYHDQEPGVDFPDLAEPLGRAVILDKAEEAAAELVIFDNFSTLATVDDENAASSFDPMIDLMRQLKVAGRAAILVHHSRKSSRGESAYRGTSKMAVVFNTIIRLDYPDGVRSHLCSFDLTFEKFRGLADATTCPLRATLDSCAGTQAWHYEASPASMLEQLVALVRTVEYGTQQELAVKLNVDQATISRLRKKAIAGRLISEADWATCLKMAKEPFEDEADDAPADF
jgi:KaiC/GvpD/RAD55 family RecA-like ATPase